MGLLEKRDLVSFINTETNIS
ncbi:MAG: hypothetical protein ACD_32C00081G0001, partial [uncultured bacterium]